MPLPATISTGAFASPGTDSIETVKIAMLRVSLPVVEYLMQWVHLGDSASKLSLLHVALSVAVHYGGQYVCALPEVLLTKGPQNLQKSAFVAFLG